jgi:hypothetical protein
MQIELVREVVNPRPATDQVIIEIADLGSTPARRRPRKNQRVRVSRAGPRDDRFVQGPQAHWNQPLHGLRIGY